MSERPAGYPAHRVVGRRAPGRHDGAGASGATGRSRARRGLPDRPLRRVAATCASGARPWTSPTSRDGRPRSTTVDHLTLLAFADGEDGRVIGGRAVHPRGRRSARRGQRQRRRRVPGPRARLDPHRAPRPGGRRRRHLHRSTRRCCPRTTGWSTSSGGAASRSICAPCPGAVEVEFPTELTEETLSAFERSGADRGARTPFARSWSRVRSRSSAPRAIRDSIGGRLLHNLLEPAVRGRRARGEPEHAMRCRASRRSRASPTSPGAVDVAFIAVPAAGVLDVARACARRRVCAGSS